MSVEDPNEDMVYAALYQGISPEEPLIKKLAQKKSSTLQGLMDKVKEHVNQEETLKAIASSKPSEDRSPERKEKRKNSGQLIEKSGGR